jgi:hypothetical protein
MGRGMVYRVTTSRLPIPAKRATFALFCAKSVTEIQFMVGNGVFCEVLPPKTSGERPDEADGKPFVVFPGRWFIITAFAADASVTHAITNGATKYICNISSSKSNP